ncbi:two-component system sensor histidine kinase YesM [Treponema rectale]|uniref:Two-component system sensor histidine kinase YesM n=1 Tax=Treponema rectale TaxID=744512 RepID=A0A840SJ19_9SPIR|nr:sensor histidine kinase [Treponema rectale]MBB5219493.1 two-component system sensor histidine kinase YesM [Treponema rectale]
MKKRILKRTLQLSYLVLVFIMAIPSVYSIIVSQIHTHRYSRIISNVSLANRIINTAKIEIPNELWEIICGKKKFDYGMQYIMMNEIAEGINQMLPECQCSESEEKLLIAQRAQATLLRNINNLSSKMKAGSTVQENEHALDDIRTITALFSDIMQEFIVTEIESGNKTNISFRNSSVILSIIQILITISAICISIKSYFTVSGAIQKPIADMERLSTKVAGGELTAKVEIPNVEELDKLAVNLNTMTEQIDLLMKKNVEEQKNFQKAEMKALQAQITPHFLYNTFDTIVWLAEEEKTDKVVKITKAFSDFLRISLSRGHEWITVQQELDHIKNYLTIQKIRYADILNYEIKSDPDLMNFKMVKLILQPLVENAIYHGIKNKRGRGELSVTVKFYDEEKTSIFFEVADNGAGFSEERLAEVRHELNAADSDTEKLSSVYGMYNVNKKLKLYYGNKTQGLMIQSERNKGSKISFIIPCQTGEENV